jgi:hypothetical protein
MDSIKFWMIGVGKDKLSWKTADLPADSKI